MAMPSGMLAVICGVVWMYAMCFMAQAPLMPYLTKQLALDAGYYGILMSTFSGLQLIGSLLSGPLVDTYGGKWLMLMSFASSAVSYSITALASNVAMLFLGRLATLMQHAVLAARTIATAHSDDSERAALLGYIGAAYGLGFALGPAAGGWLSSSSLATAAWAAAAGSVLAFVVVAVGLPADAPKQAGRKQPPGDPHTSTSSSKAPGFNAANLIAAARCPGVPPLLAVQAGAGLAGAVFQSTFSLVLQQQYKLSSQQNGMVLSYVGCCIVVGQAVVIKQVSKRLGETATVKAGCAVLAVSFLGIGASAGCLWQLLAWLLPMSLGSVTVVTVNVARLTKAVPSHMAGSIVALDMSMGSGLRTLSPLIGTWLLRHYGYSVVCCFSASLLAAVLLVQQMLVPRAAADAAGSDKKDS